MVTQGGLLYIAKVEFVSTLLKSIVLAHACKGVVL